MHPERCGSSHSLVITSNPRTHRRLQWAQFGGHHLPLSKERRQRKTTSYRECGLLTMVTERTQWSAREVLVLKSHLPSFVCILEASICSFKVSQPDGAGQTLLTRPCSAPEPARTSGRAAFTTPRSGVSKFRHCCLRSYHSISEGLGHSREVTRDARVQSAVCVHLHQTTLPTPEPARGNSV